VRHGLVLLLLVGGVVSSVSASENLSSFLPRQAYVGDGRAGVTKTGGLTKKVMPVLCFSCFLCSDPEERSDLSTTEPAKMNECENGQSFSSPLLMIAVNNSHLPRQALDVTHERKNARRTI